MHNTNTTDKAAHLLACKGFVILHRHLQQAFQEGVLHCWVLARKERDVELGENPAHPTRPREMKVRTNMNACATRL
jgi:hypothetical protein